ncbi:glycosyltransferase family 4 protein [Marivivens donghaensis]|uniref:Glycosyltransferase family 4 protein n=1 Tax=Marivivens donghaensis TaxID=1699413 RepID=A0ABX0VU88_9RHOB|nr:glycosyltransferase family 4 protein [Marivivens donghaensis]NIY71385.1 glycosyltransferase family 4 protein [Marivivens donghaensis]
MGTASAPAFFYHPDAVETAGKDLVGRRSAGQTALKAFIKHSPGPTLNIVTDTPKGQTAFERVAAQLGANRPIDGAVLRSTDDFTRFGTVFFPVPGFNGATWRRQRFQPEACSLVGITHTVSTRRVIEQLHNQLLEPVEEWDAIICTSRAVKTVVSRQLALSAEFIRRRFGATRIPLPQLPVIPLSVDASDFRRNSDYRAEARAKFGAPEDAIVIMTMGRLTVGEKANPVPLYQVLERLAQRLDRPVHLWQVGWARREEDERFFVDGPAALCPSVTSRIIDGRDEWVRRAIWSGADIFTLPVDNIQETFGIVPIEAMAASLPVVMPDWDGFRDTVRHGETGFLIPTRMARAGNGGRIASRFADGRDSYLGYLSLVSNATEIDQEAYLVALERLARDPILREKMGRGGATHVAQNFDLKPVMNQYLRLADELAARREVAKSHSKRLSPSAVSPIEVDPFALYRGYPAEIVTDQTEVAILHVPTVDEINALDRLNGRAHYDRRIMPLDRTVRNAVQMAVHAPATLASLSKSTGIGVLELELTVLFLAKYGMAKLSSQQ